LVKGSHVQKVAVIGGFAAIGGLVIFVIFLQISSVQNATFKQQWDGIAYDSIALTKEYQAQESKWVAKQYDNKTMAGIVDSYMPRYQQLIDRANAMQTPDKYAESRDLMVKAIQTEKDSNEHFKAYLLTGKPAEYKMVQDLTSLSLKYSSEADEPVKAAG
jgi:hypothetical protein